LARGQFLDDCPHGQRGGKEDEYIGENLSKVSMSEEYYSAEENCTVEKKIQLDEVAAREAVSAVGRGTWRMNATTTKLRR